MNREELIAKYGDGTLIPVLDYGHVTLVDVMGGDERIEQVARLSYQKGTRKVSETRGLLRYLLRNKHTSPFEQAVITLDMKMPIFVARQLVRHRTQCLSGDTELHFDLPGGIERRGTQLYKLTIKDVYDRWQATKGEQGNPLFKRERVQGMLLRCVNEATNTPSYTHIRDCWRSGVKPVFAVTLSGGRVVKMSEDHRCLTNKGWLRLKEFVSDPDVLLKVVAPEHKRVERVASEFSAEDLLNEQWRRVVDPQNRWVRYEVSDLGRVRSLANTRGVLRSVPVLKEPTVTDSGHAVVSLSSSGKSLAFYVHRLVLDAFVGLRPEGLEACHSDGNGLNNRLGNLRWDTLISNQREKTMMGAVPSLACVFESVVSIECVGEEMTYDIEVDGPWHNFSANGMIVHNSLNELSGRYSELPEEFYVPLPEQICYQSTDNKQGRSIPLPEEEAWQLQQQMHVEAGDAFTSYRQFLEAGVSRETARMNLPLSTYTQWCTTMNLHNLLHMLSLRLDPHAQWECRQYAEAIWRIVKDWCPITAAAFEDFVLNAETFSAQELLVVRTILGSEHLRNTVLLTAEGPTWSEREKKEFLKKLGISE